MEAISVEEAKSIPLPLNPIDRVREIGELASGFGLRMIGSKGTGVFTRRGLVRLAQASENAREIVTDLRNLEKQEGEV